MNLKDVSRVLIAATAFCSAFWLYGMGRTMSETVDFNVTAAANGLFITFLFTPFIAVPALVVGLHFKLMKSRPRANAVAAFAGCLLLGCVFSEQWILTDESNFRTELKAVQAGELYGRPRSWPNELASLVFVPGQGIHATD